ncbi:MAG: stalk domain-containing protein, partial [Abditibacteriaceae bacterium]
SNQAVINGRNKTLSVPTQIYQNYLYAPVGDLAEGVGGTVTWDSQRNGVRVTVGNKHTLWVLRDPK